MPYVPRQLLSLMIFILVFFMALSGSLEASSLPWIEHRVNPGDTVETIALSYGIDSFSIRRANEMPENVIPSERSVILVPRDKSLLIETRAEVRARSSGETTAGLYSHEEDNRGPLPETTGTDAGQGMTTLSGVFSPLWPVIGKVYSRFGPRRGRFHTGIDISAPRGTPIKAVADGRVVRAATRRGYGRSILIDHGNGTMTRYSHCDTMLCKAGDKIAAGQKIGTVGRTGRATGPHLHFEVIINGKHKDPEKYLPSKK